MSTDTNLKIEKSLGIEHWVSFSVVIHNHKTDGSVDYHSKSTLRNFQMTREQYERRRWLPRYAIACYQVVFPRCLVSNTFAFYDKKTGGDQEYITAKRRASTYKAQITKAKTEL